MDGDDEARPDWLYPLAPLPAHERVWRHPSEVGQLDWARSEPPLVIGRRLVGAVGVIGGLLTVTMLWAVFSSHAGTGSSATVATSRRSVELLNWVLPRPHQSTLEDVAATVANSTASGSVVATSPGSTTPSSTASAGVPIVASTAPSTIGQPPVVAVRVGSSGMLALTTAAVIADQHDTVVIGLPDGSTTEARIVYADLHGIAVLRLADSDAPRQSPALAIGSEAHDGDAAFVGTDTTPLLISETSAVSFRLSGDARGCAAAGEPVLDGSGKLIGLCQTAADNIVVDVQFVRALQQTLDELGS